jgi:hypothetical protein
MPPHRPDLASPTPTQRGSITPRRIVGPGSHRFAKCRPWRLGRNPETAFHSVK